MQNIDDFRSDFLFRIAPRAEPRERISWDGNLAKRGLIESKPFAVKECRIPMNRSPAVEVLCNFEAHQNVRRRSDCRPQVPPIRIVFSHPRPPLVRSATRSTTVTPAAKQKIPVKKRICTRSLVIRIRIRIGKKIQKKRKSRSMERSPFRLFRSSGMLLAPSSHTHRRGRSPGKSCR